MKFEEPDKPKQPLQKDQLIWLIPGVIILLVLFIAEIIKDYHPVKLSILFIIILWLPLTAVHEIGHAIMAKLMKWKITEISVGFGNVIYEKTIAETKIILKSVPIEGFVKCQPMRIKKPNLEHRCIYFAGPGVELLIAAVIAYSYGFDVFFARSENIGLIFWQSFALAATVGAVLNLIPISANDINGNVTHVSDGMGIYFSFINRRKFYIDWLKQVKSDEKDIESS